MINNDFHLFDIITKKLIKTVNLKEILKDIESKLLVQIYFSKNTEFIYFYYHPEKIYLVNINTMIKKSEFNSTIETKEFCIDPNNKYHIIHIKNNEIEFLDFKLEKLIHKMEIKNIIKVSFIKNYNDKLIKKIFIVTKTNIKIVEFDFGNNLQFKNFFDLEINEDNYCINAFYDHNFNCLAVLNNKNILKIYENLNLKRDPITYSLEENPTNFFFYNFHSKFTINQLNFCYISKNKENSIFYIQSIKNEKNKNLFKLSSFSKIYEIKYWDSNFMMIGPDFIKVIEFETLPNWVNFGFKFNKIDSNIEYIEKENEFDQTNEKIQEKHEINLEISQNDLSENWYFLLKWKKNEEKKSLIQYSEKINISFL